MLMLKPVVVRHRPIQDCTYDHDDPETDKPVPAPLFIQPHSLGEARRPGPGL